MAKTNPTSIRFDSEKFDFVKESEKLQTAQKVVDFLLDKYWWDKRNVQYATVTPNSFDGGKIGKNVKDESLQWEEPKISQYEAYVVELRAATSIFGIKHIVKAAKSDSTLTAIEKEKTEQLGIQLSQNFDF